MSVKVTGHNAFPELAPIRVPYVGIGRLIDPPAEAQPRRRTSYYDASRVTITFGGIELRGYKDLSGTFRRGYDIEGE